MNWRRGLFRLWIVGTVLFVLAIAFISYSEVKWQFDAREGASIQGEFADWVYQRFYSDMPREQVDKKITALKPTAQLEAIMANLDTSRPYDEWTSDELRAYLLYRIIEPNRIIGAPSLWAIYGKWAIMRASIAFGIPLAVLVLGASLVWGLSGFAAKRS